MGQSLLVTLREGLEAGLIVVIVLTYLSNAGQRAYWKHVLLGTAAAIGLSLLVGAVIFVAAGEFEGRAEQVFDGSAMLTAVAVLSWMIVWMKSQAIHIRGRLQMQVQSALAVGSALALAAIPFVAVLREGIETALFMFAAARTSTPVESTLGASLGLAGALALSYAFYRGGRRISLRLFFNVTGVLLILFAAGLLAHGIDELHEAGLLPPVVEHVWDINGVLSDSEGVGEWLKGIFGYNGSPSLVEVVAYPLYLGVAFWYFLRVRPEAPRVGLRPVAGGQPAVDGGWELGTGSWELGTGGPTGVPGSTHVSWGDCFLRSARASSATIRYTSARGRPCWRAKRRQASYSGETWGSSPSSRFTLTAADPRLDSNSRFSRPASRRPTSLMRTPRVDVSRSSSPTTASSRSWGQRTARRVAGRFFFIWMGTNQTSAAPASKRRSCT